MILIKPHNDKTLKKNHLLPKTGRNNIFTYYIEPHAKSALPCSVPGHTLIHSSMVHSDDLYDE